VRSRSFEEVLAMRRTTQILVAIIGVAVVGIATGHLILGGGAVIGGSPLNATAEGEHRFFAAMFLCYGFGSCGACRASRANDGH
jgi:VIT1/CCC1 family predicted Fe2+/Mn2+ transporter